MVYPFSSFCHYEDEVHNSVLSAEYLFTFCVLSGSKILYDFDNVGFIF